MKQTVVGKLFMHGCGHCVTLEEPWAQMKKKIEKKVMVAGDIESAETHKLDELNQKYGSDVAVQGGYPTIYKIKHSGKVEYYNGERTAPKLVSWALNKRQKTVKRGGRRTKTSKK